MKKIVSFIFICFLVFNVSTAAYAEGDFIATPIFDSQQKDLSKGYFIVNGKPGEKVQFSIKVENNNKVQSSFIVKPTDAFSNPFSIMEYTNKKETEYSSILKDAYRFTKLMPEQVEFKLNPGDSKNLSFEAVIPSSLKSGHILGAFQVEETNPSQHDISTTEKETNKKSNVELAVKKKFILGAMIHLSEPGNINLDFVSLSSYVEGILPVILLELNNIEPYIADNLSIDYQVFKKGSKKLLFENSQDIFSLAPSTSIKLPLKWLYKNYEVDTYTMKFKIYNKKTDETILTSSEDFKIESKDVKVYTDKNEQESFFFPKAINRLPLIYLNIVFLLIASFLVFKRRKKHIKSVIKEEDDNKETDK